MAYRYDFGDQWEHLIIVTDRASTTSKFRCISGTGHAIAEDVQQDGWAKLKEAYRIYRPHKQQREKWKWYEQQASNGDPTDLRNGGEHVFDKHAVDTMLSVRTV